MPKRNADEVEDFNSIIIPHLQDCFNALSHVIFAPTVAQRSEAEPLKLHVVTLRLLCWAQAWRTSLTTSPESALPRPSLGEETTSIRAAVDPLRDIIRLCHDGRMAFADLHGSSANDSYLTRFNIDCEVRYIAAKAEASSDTLIAPLVCRDRVRYIQTQEAFDEFISAVAEKAHWLLLQASPDPDSLYSAYQSVQPMLRSRYDLRQLYEASRTNVDPLLQSILEILLEIPETTNCQASERTEESGAQQLPSGQNYEQFHFHNAMIGTIGNSISGATHL